MATNGRISPLSLRTVQDGIKLEKNTARQYQAMAAAFKRETGFAMSIARPAGGYRDLALQADMRREWFAGHIPGKYGFSRSSKVAPAVAGYSNHGYGTCVDIAVGAPWAEKNAHRFGFSRPFGNSDPNHFQYNGTTVTASVGGTTSVPKPKDSNPMAPRVFNHKVTVTTIVKGKTVKKTVKEWCRFWETSIETTQNGDHATLWKQEAGQISATKNLSSAAFGYLRDLVNLRRAANNLPKLP